MLLRQESPSARKSFLVRDLSHSKGIASLGNRQVANTRASGQNLRLGSQLTRGRGASLLLLLLLNLLLRRLLALVPVSQEHIARILHNLQLGAQYDNAGLDQPILTLCLLVLILPGARHICVRAQCNLLDLVRVFLDDGQVSLKL
jgi:hypothetical protein